MTIQLINGTRVIHRPSSGSCLPIRKRETNPSHFYLATLAGILAADSFFRQDSMTRNNERMKSVGCLINQSQPNQIPFYLNDTGSEALRP